MFGDPINNPNNWTIKSLRDMGYCKNGMNYHLGDNGVEIPCLGVGDFKDLSIIDGTANLSKVSLKRIPSKENLLRNGDIVFVRSNGNKELVGRCLVVYPHDIPTTYSGFCIRYRMTSDDLNTCYLVHLLKTESIKRMMIGQGTNIHNLNQKILLSLCVPIPPMNLQKEYADFVKLIDKSKFTC